MKYQNITTIVSAIVIVIAVTMVFGTKGDVIAEEPKQYKLANNVKVNAIFEFMDGTEQVSFQVFEQVNGFDSKRGSAQFELEGVIDSDRRLLYKAADMAFIRGLDDHKHEYSHFDVDVILENGMTLRKFQYDNCRVTDYKVRTEFDKDKPWVYNGGFALLDEFKITCNGYMPVNVLESYHNVQEEAKTTSSLDLKEKPDYTTHPKFQN